MKLKKQCMHSDSVVHSYINSIIGVEVLCSSSSAMSLSTSFYREALAMYLEYWTVQRPLVVRKVKRVITGKLFALEEFQRPNGGWGSMIIPSALNKQ